MHVVSITVKKRQTEIPEVQEILTKYGENILARLGVHNCEKENNGLIVIIYEKKNIEKFVEELNTIKNIEVNFMEV